MLWAPGQLHTQYPWQLAGPLAEKIVREGKGWVSQECSGPWGGHWVPNLTCGNSQLWLFPSHVWVFAEGKHMTIKALLCLEVFITCSLRKAKSRNLYLSFLFQNVSAELLEFDASPEEKKIIILCPVPGGRLFPFPSRRKLIKILSKGRDSRK